MCTNESAPVPDNENKPSAKKRAEQENVKTASNFLRGTILKSFENRVTASVPENDNMLLKFHGTYMQDNRDLRDERARQRLEPAFDFMVRIRAPAASSHRSSGCSWTTLRTNMPMANSASPRGSRSNSTAC